MNLALIARNKLIFRSSRFFKLECSLLRNAPAALAGSEKLNELIGVHVQKLLKIHTTVGILPEGPLLGSLVRHFCNFYAPSNCR